jgi:two-component system, OmpR family, sensor histidine kinase KdpD
MWLRIAIALACVALITAAGFVVIPVNATTMGFAYLLLVLILASVWGFVEAAAASIAATLAFNYYFLPPILRFTIADPQNWVALFSFLLTSLIASRLSILLKRREAEAVSRQLDLERLYTFSRSILLIEHGKSFPRQLIQRMADVFEVSAVVLYERSTGLFHRAGPNDFEGFNDQLREAALNGTSYSDPARRKVITAVRLGAEPIAALAIEGASIPDSVLQSIANLVAIGLERARTQESAGQAEAARQSEQLRTTLLDAMAHELKTPLTSVMAATSALLADPDQPNRAEMLRIAGEEASRLNRLIEDSLEMASLDSTEIRLHPEYADACEIVRDVIASMRHQIDGRPIEVRCDEKLAGGLLDPHLIKLALRQVLDNALKYSPPGTPVRVNVLNGDGRIVVEIIDHGPGIPDGEQSRVFDRLYRGGSPAVRQVPGMGLGLSIAQNIVRAHGGEIAVDSQPEQTAFRVSLPVSRDGVRA